MKKCRVGILFDFKHPIHCRAAALISQGLRRDCNFEVSHVNTPLDQKMVKDKVRACVVSSEGYDVIVPLGLRCAAYTKAAIAEVGEHPVIYAGVRDPVAFGLVEDLERPGGKASAVICMPPKNTAAAEKLSLLSGYFERVLVPYWTFGSSDVLVQQVEEIRTCFEAAGVMVVARKATSHEDMIEWLKSELKQGDAVLLLEGNAGAAHAEVSYLCWERDALLCADGVDSIEQGAASALIFSLEALATGVVDKLKEFWIDGVDLGMSPVTCVNDEKIFVVNTAVLRMLGLSLEPVLRLKSREGVFIIKKWPNCPL